MKNEFVSYEIALALKELGFDEPCFWWYDFEKELRKDRIGVNSINSKYFLNGNSCSAPLYQQAFRWFIEKYGLFAEITLWGDGLGFISMIKEIKQEEFIEVYQKAIIDRGLPIWSYEEAELECLKKLIEIVKAKNETT